MSIYIISGTRSLGIASPTHNSTVPRSKATARCEGFYRGMGCPRTTQPKWVTGSVLGK